MSIIDQIRRKWMKMRLQPIRVYCFHHVCSQFNSESMPVCDWMALDEFQRKIISLRQSGVEFISMTEAYSRIKNDIFRFHKYAVITFDDGYASLNEVLPWLRVEGIPVTLFVNTDYAAGNSFRETDKEKYLTFKELEQTDAEIGMHGYQHLDATKMTEMEFQGFLKKSSINNLQFSIPFWAYTWGRHNSMTDDVLKSRKIVPVLMDGMKNYNDASCIHRELLE